MKITFYMFITLQNSLWKQLSINQLSITTKLHRSVIPSRNAYLHIHCEHIQTSSHLSAVTMSPEKANQITHLVMILFSFIC